MMYCVIKRNGNKERFNPEKVQTAMELSGVSSERSSMLTKFVQDTMYQNTDVETIHQMVLEVLRANNELEAAERYTSYKEGRDQERSKPNDLMEAFIAIVEGTDEETFRENANKPAERLPTMRDLIAGNMTKQYTLKHVFPKHLASAHNDGTLHIHDADYIGLPMINCCLLNVKGMLEEGFMMGSAQIETPDRVHTAANIIAQIIAQTACNQFGGITVPFIDEVLEPYAAKSYQRYLKEANKWGTREPLLYARTKTIEEIEKAVACIEYQINTMQTSNGQQPFTTITFGLTTSWEGRELQKAFLKQRIKGLGKDGVTPVFPKICFIRAEGVNKTKDDPNYDIKQLAVKCSSKRLYPDWLDKEQLDLVTGGLPQPMGCRSFLGPHPDGYVGRANLGVCSINVPRCAIKAGGDMTKFWKELDRVLGLAKEVLNVRIGTCKKIKAKVAPILYLEGGYGLKAESPEELVFDRFFSNNRASISVGYIGLYDACVAMFGHGHHESPEAYAFAEEVVRYLKSRVDSWKEEEKIGYSLYGSPSENLCGRFSLLDKKLFGVIENITDKGYHQNAYNLDVRAKMNPLEKVRFESVFPRHASGGFISYGELPNMKNNLEGLEQIIDFALDNVPYYAVNVPNDFCLNPECRHEGEFPIEDNLFTCPRCGNNDQLKMVCVRRVSGYLGSPNNRPFPVGKTLEMLKRVKNK